jgi:hypothetical protein
MNTLGDNLSHASNSLGTLVKGDSSMHVRTIREFSDRSRFMSFLLREVMYVLSNALIAMIACRIADSLAHGKFGALIFATFLS